MSRDKLRMLFDSKVFQAVFSKCVTDSSRDSLRFVGGFFDKKMEGHKRKLDFTSKDDNESEISKYTTTIYIIKN